MYKFIGQRLLSLPPVLLGISLLAFCLLQLPAEDAADMLYKQSGGAAPAVLEQTRIQLGLDQPLYKQYLLWLYNFLLGDAGVSFISRQPVSQLFWEKLPATLELTTLSLLITLLAAIPLGICCALYSNRWPDNLLRVLAFFGNGTPGFFTAFLLLYIFALHLKLFPVTGGGDFGMILPALSLALPMTGKYMRHIRAEILRELAQPYVSAALLRGMSQRSVLLHFILRSTLPTAITITALSIGSLLGGTAIIESIFMIDGIGRLGLEAIIMKDYPVVLSYVVWTAFIYTFVNLAADIIQRWLNPQQRQEVQP